MSPIAKHVTTTVVVLGLGAFAGAALFIWSGAYDIGADAPHWRPVHAVLEKTVERSMTVRADKLQVPTDLGDRARVVAGAGNYEAMCASCHLSPGIGESELSRGLYPRPPNLTKEPISPAHAFWAIKHGIKASGMPAWGKSMDDQSVWDLAAFVQELPKLDESGYREMVAASGGHSHGEGGGESGHHGEGAGEPGHHSEGGGESGHHGESGGASAPRGSASDASGGGGSADSHHDAEKTSTRTPKGKAPSTEASAPLKSKQKESGAHGAPGHGH